MAAELEYLLIQYAQVGLREWLKEKGDLRRRATQWLGNSRIAESDWDVSQTVRTRFNGENHQSLKFLPMPCRPQHSPQRSFFLPIREEIDGGETVSFDLFLIIDEENALAFRFEPADEPPSTHQFSHVQMCRSLIRKKIAPHGIPKWVPNSYPAFPLPKTTSDPLHMFFALATSVHGYPHETKGIIAEVFQKNSRSNLIQKYGALLDNLLSNQPATA